MPKFGGEGRLRQSYKYKKCLQLYPKPDKFITAKEWRMFWKYSDLRKKSRIIFMIGASAVK